MKSTDKEFQDWKWWELNIHATCTKHGDDNRNPPHCFKTPLAIRAGTCSMETCPRWQEEEEKRRANKTRMD